MNKINESRQEYSSSRSWAHWQVVRLLIRQASTWHGAGIMAVAIWTFVAFSWLASAQTGATPHLTLLGPKDPGFDAAIQENFAGITSLDNFTQIRPYLIVLENQTAFAAKAYDIEWTIVLSDQSFRYQDFRYFYQPLTPVGFSKIIHKGEVRLLSPVFNLSQQEFADEKTYVGSLTPSMFLAFPNVSAIFAVVDGALFEDGRFTGPNRQKFLEHIQSSQIGQHDESVLILDKINSGESLASILTFLDTQVQQSPDPRGSLRSRHHQYAVEREAEMLRSVGKSQGLDGLRQRVLILQKQLPEIVHKVAE